MKWQIWHFWLHNKRIRKTDTKGIQHLARQGGKGDPVGVVWDTGQMVYVKTTICPRKWLMIFSGIFRFKRITQSQPVGWGCRIHPLFLCRDVRRSSTSVLVTDSKAPILDLWKMWSTPSLPLLQVHTNWAVVPVRLPPLCQIELFNH